MAKKSVQKHEAGKRKAKTGAANRGNKKGQGALKAGSAFTYSNASSKAGRTAPNGETKVKTAGSHLRSESTIKRLDMYKKKPNMHKMREQPNGPVRIQPDRRWFGNTRVIAQDKMQAFRETIAKGVEDPFSVVLKSSKLPMSLLKETEGKASRMDLLSIQPYQETFSKRRQQKRVKLGNYDLEGLLESVDKKNEGYNEQHDKQLQVDLATGHELEGAKAGAVTGHNSEQIFNKGTSRRIWNELYKVVDASDVVVFVLDARDPMGTRCLHLERELRKNKAHKHVVLVLNKVDLVPTWVSRRWIQTLMKDFPTIAFHASITNPFGKNSLLNLLRQFSTLMKDKKHITVGMIGYPNVGKSSVINTLKRKKVCKSAPVPGETRVWQYIALTKRLYLLDCPGIVPATASDFNADCAKVLKGVVRAERIQSPSDYIDEVLSRVKKPYLLQRYKLPADTEYKDAEEFLTILGRKMGKLVKGGDADIETAARIVLYDWQRGRIPYFTAPPESESSASASSSSTAAAAAAADGGEASASSSLGAAAEGGEAAASGEASSSSSAAAGKSGEGDEEPVQIAVEQSLAELSCSLQFDDEDRRGEVRASDATAAAAEAREEAEDGGEDAPAGGRPAGVPPAAGAGKKRKKQQQGGKEDAAEGSAAGEKKAPSGGAGKKRRRGGGGGGAGGGGGRNSGDPSAPGGGRANSQLRPGAPDWQAVVAEFGM